MRIKISATTILLFFLLIASARAQVEEFGFIGDNTIEAFRCTTAKGTFSIINTGDYISTYFLSIDGRAADWATVIPGSFELNPAEEQIINISLDVPCDARLGKNSLKIYINTASGLEELFEINVYVDKPFNIEVEADETEKTIDPCQETAFELKITNPFDFEEKYSLSIKGLEEDAELSEKRFTLKGFESKDLAITVTPKDCEKTGTFQMSLLAETENTDIKSTTDFEIEITNNGVLEIAKGIERIKANYSESSAELSLINKGDESTDYTLKVEGPAWVRLDKISTTIGAGETEKLQVITKPAEEISAGDYQVTVKAIVDKTGAEYPKKITIRLIKPNFFDKLLTDYSSYFIAGIVLIIIIVLVISMLIKKVRSKEYRKKREEAKKLKEKLKAQKEKEKQRLKEERERTRLEKEKELSKAKKLREQELRKEFAFIPKKEAKRKRVPTKWFLRLLLLIIVLAAITGIYHFRNPIEENSSFFIAGIIILIILYLIDRILTGWSKTARFKRVLAGQKNYLNTKWRKGLGQVDIILRNPVKKLKLRVIRGRQRRAYSAPGEKVYQYFIINANINEEDVKQTEFRFKVAERWLRRNGISPSDVKIVKLVDGKWAGIETVKTSSDKRFVYYKASSDSLGQFAILGKVSKKEKKARSWNIFIGIVLIAIAIAIAGYLPSAMQKPTVAKGIPPQIWTQGTTRSLDLTQYFKDPDGKMLKFEASSVENIDLWINSDGVVTFTPDFDFHGERNVIFTAYDEQGLEVSSNNVKLVVTKSLLPLSIRQHLSFILAGIIILIFIILVLIFRKPLKSLMNE